MSFSPRGIENTTRCCGIGDEDFFLPRGRRRRVTLGFVFKSNERTLSRVCVGHLLHGEPCVGHLIAPRALKKTCPMDIAGVLDFLWKHV